MSTILGLNEIAFWIVVTSALVNVACGVLGCFLVLRRMSMLGDAISHAVLPGLAVAFLVSSWTAGEHGSAFSSPWLMFTGALLAGLLTALLSELIHRYSGVHEDAALGVVFTSFFAMGVVLITRLARQVDLDPGCVLYGLLEAVALDVVNVAGFDVPRATLTMALVLLVVLVCVTAFWKELKIVSFDPQLATTLGFRAELVHYLLMALVAAVTVAAFEAVGSILVVAMLIVPAAAAYLLTDRLSWMVVLSSLIGIASAVVGRWGAARVNTSVAGAVAVAAGGFFVLAVLFAPRHGYLAKVFRRTALALRIVREDALLLLYRRNEERPGTVFPSGELLAALGGGLLPRCALVALRWSGAAKAVGGGWSLEPSSAARARELLRGHRLWESYLADQLGVPTDHIHEPADRVEHFIGPEIREQLAETTGRPKKDPQGRSIPENGLTTPASGSGSLSKSVSSPFPPRAMGRRIDTDSDADERREN
jgi:manganese/zinc/iron transport system permease protein